MNFKKNVVVNREGYNPVELKIQIKENNLYVKLSNEIMIIDLARYLLEHTPLLGNQVKRKCPYKLKIDRHRDNFGCFTHKSYLVDYLEVQNGILVEKSNHIIDLLGSNMKVNGEFQCYAPDLLLVFEERGFIKKQEDETFIKNRDFKTNVEFNENIPLLSPNELVSKGYLVPKFYNDRFKATPNTIIKDKNKALVIGVKDVSGSMGVWENAVLKEYFDLALSGIKSQYNDVAEVYITHSTEAKVVDKVDFFGNCLSGGTILSSGIRAILPFLENTDREIIILQLSDGDNLTSDSCRVIKLLSDEILPKVKYFKYVEINQCNRHTAIMNGYKQIKENNFDSLVIKERDGSLKGLRFKEEIEALN
jgi:hypothetical protein